MWEEGDFILLAGVRRLGHKNYVMYHGRKANLGQGFFHLSRRGILGRGVYLSRKKASRYPLGLSNHHQKVVIRVLVNVGRVNKVTYKGGLQKTTVPGEETDKEEEEEGEDEEEESDDYEEEKVHYEEEEVDYVEEENVNYEEEEVDHEDWL
uniref:Uncharacterized protein n=1 Tax=Oncorhynchus tshawytscha TaxID=74940 RepID=A0A8C8I9J7_ONCTS